jgi:Mn-containing catalase
MFRHVHELQFDAAPDAADPAFARRLQEVLGGKWGELTVAMQYLFQGWNCRLPGKYKDMLLDIGTEELAHVEMLTTMIDRLLDGAPLSPDDSSGAAFTAANPQHTIVNGGGASLHDANGVPWSGAFVTSSGNLLADFHLNVTAEMQGRLQVTRLYHMTEDQGVRALLRFLITRDHMHQLQWLKAIEEVQSDGLDGVPVPEAFPVDREYEEFARRYIHASDGAAALEGGWATGIAVDGQPFHADPTPVAHGERPTLAPGDPRLFGTPPGPSGFMAAMKDMLTS